ncbi:MAG TPA: hypothetical protein VGN04_06220 [Herbaspirillum sp.]
MSINSALFSTQIIHDMGGDPRAGLTLLNRLASQEIAPPLITLSLEQKKMLEEFIDGLVIPQTSLSTATQPTASK